MMECRRASFRSWCPKGRGSSNLPTRTIVGGIGVDSMGSGRGLIRLGYPNVYHGEIS